MGLRSRLLLFGRLCLLFAGAGLLGFGTWPLLPPLADIASPLVSAAAGLGAMLLALGLSPRARGALARWRRVLGAIPGQDVAGVAGGLLVTGGLWMIAPAAALLGAGVMLVVLAWILTPRSSPKPEA